MVRIFAEGIVGYGQIRPLAPHHSMPDTYATMISMIKDVCGPKLIGQSIFDVEGIHALFDSLAPQNFMARAAVDAALYDAMGKAVGQPVYNLIGGLNQKRAFRFEWSISMASDPRKGWSPTPSAHCMSSASRCCASNPAIPMAGSRTPFTSA